MMADDGISNAPEMAQDIVARSNKLLQEMEQLRQRHQAVRGSHKHIPGLSMLIDVVRQEKKSAQSFLVSQPDGQDDGGSDKKDALVEAVPRESRLRFTNVPAIERNWEIAKRCRDLVSIESSIPKIPKMEENGKGSRPNGQAKTKGDVDTVFIHAIVDGGAEWLRTINKDEKRLLLEMAAGGWDWDTDEEENEEDDRYQYDDIPLLRTAKELADTARRYWLNYHHPRIRLLLTKIQEGQSKEVDRLIQKMRAAGGADIHLTVECADSKWLANQPPLDIDTALSNLVIPEDISCLGETVLLDTSVLIALASDISHAKVEAKPWHGVDSRGQIEDEANGLNFLLSNAYPRLRGRQLLCTKEAFEHFREITTTIASPTETERARILTEGGPEDLRTLSIHPVPDDLMLPVQVLQGNDTYLHAKTLVDRGILPDVAIQVEHQLLSVPGNRATHLYGWYAGVTVVTSNRTLAKRLVRMVEKSLDGDYKDGPRTCVLPYNRALATKGPRKPT